MELLANAIRDGAERLHHDRDFEAIARFGDLRRFDA